MAGRGELDLRPFWTSATDAERAPASIEFEQAVLGILLYAPESFAEVDGLVGTSDFFEPFHGRLFDAIGRRSRAGRLVEATMLAEVFSVDPAFNDLGGVRYLADLIDRCPPTGQVAEYARHLRSLALRRQVLEICAELANKAASDAESTGEELLAEMERRILGTAAAKADVTLTTFAQAAARVIEAIDHPEERPTLKTGLYKIDEPTGGFEKGDLIVIGARPSMGKSALASCIALNLSTAGHGVVEVNGEMKVDQMTRRHLTDWAYTRYGDAGPTYRDIRRRILTEGQKTVLRQCERELRALPLDMMKRTGLTLSRARSILRRKKMVWEDAGVPFTAVVFDHVGLMAPEANGGRSRVEDQTALSYGLKALADDLDCVVFALAQLNRKVEEREDKRPQLADLRDSGSWEQDADMVIGIYRDAYYARREAEPKRPDKLAEWLSRCSSTTVEAIFLKMREGDVAVAKLFADIGRNAIRDEAPEFVLI